MANPLRYVDPFGLKTTIMVVSNYGVGTHVAVHSDGAGKPILYDPAGSYSDSHGAEANVVTGDAADPASFVEFHLAGEHSPSIMLIPLPTTLS